jgi:hypothetical protein
MRCFFQSGRGANFYTSRKHRKGYLCIYESVNTYYSVLQIGAWWATALCVDSSASITVG